jgi:phosphatidylglycerophosphatase A
MSSPHSTTSADEGVGRRAPGGPAPSSQPIRRPDFAFMRPRAARWIALGMGSGLSRMAPGTVGTLWAWAAWLVAAPHLSGRAGLLVIALGLAVGPWACARTAEALGVADHGAIVWDEIVAFWIVLAVLPGGFSWQLTGFVVFRFFDIVKPPPIRWADTRFKGGAGVMLDDLMAAFYTLLVLAAWQARV